MSKPRIAFVIFGGNAIGGADKRFVNLFNHLSLNNTEFDFFLLISQAKYNSLQKSGVINPQMTSNTIVIPEMNPSKDAVHSLYRKHKNVLPLFIRQFRAYLKSWYDFMKHKKLLIKFYSDYQIDMVHMFNRALFAGGILRKNMPKPKLIYTMSDPLILDMSSSLLKYQASNLHALKNADHIDFLYKETFEQVMVLKNKVKLPSYSFSPGSFVIYSNGKANYDDKELSISFIARLIPSKNPLLFVEIAKEILKMSNKPIHFYLCGAGPLRQIIENKISEYHLSKDISLQYCPNVVYILEKSMMLVSLTQIENYYNQVNLEAMAYENVIITTNLEISKDICPGIIVLEPDAQTIALKIIELLENPEKIKQMGQAARQFAMQNHNVEKFAHYITGIYREVLKTRMQ